MTWRVLAALFVCGLLAWAGWQAAEWRAKAQLATGYQAELRAELRRRVASDAARLRVQRALDDTIGKLQAGVVTAQKVIVRRVVQKADCDIADPVVVGLLNRARAGDLPAAAAAAAGAGAAPVDLTGIGGAGQPARTAVDLDR